MLCCHHGQRVSSIVGSAAIPFPTLCKHMQMLLTSPSSAEKHWKVTMYLITSIIG